MKHNVPLLYLYHCPTAINFFSPYSNIFLLNNLIILEKSVYGMYGEYFRHLLNNRLHDHFPDFEKTTRITIEEQNTFITVIREFHPTVRLSRPQVIEMKTAFLSYLKRRSGSYKKHSFKPCQGTIGRWGRRRSSKPIMELTYECYDGFYYKNWINSEILDRITWSNIIPLRVSNSYCPCGSKNGLIFIID